MYDAVWFVWLFAQAIRFMLVTTFIVGYAFIWTVRLVLKGLAALSRAFHRWLDS